MLIRALACFSLLSKYSCWAGIWLAGKALKCLAGTRLKFFNTIHTKL